MHHFARVQALRKTEMHSLENAIRLIFKRLHLPAAPSAGTGMSRAASSIERRKTNGANPHQLV
jgi:hypothetical protein